MASRPLSTVLLALLGAVASTSACEIPDEPLSDDITEMFSIFVQNPSFPIIHNRVMTFRANGDDEHLNLEPAGRTTFDTLYLEDGLLRTRNIHGVIDLEYSPSDDTTKLFMTERDYHPTAIFQPVYGCDPDTDELQIQLQLVSRLTDPPVEGGQIGVRQVVGDYEFRYSPPGNTLVDPGSPFIPITMVIFRSGESPPPPSSTISSSTISSTTSSSTASSTASSTTVSPTQSPTESSSSSSTSSQPTPTNSGELPPIGDFDFVSCWAEPPTGRALTAAFSGGDDMTLEKCAEFCSEYPYFGTEWNRECFCGTVLASGSAPAPLSECDFPCTGDATQMCGGSRRLSLYQNENWVAPEQPSSIGDYEFFGCVTDSPGLRTLSESVMASPDMTLETCATFCSGFEFFGAEWSIECWCGNSFTEGATLVDASECSMTCGGNSDTLCGNGDRLSVYQVAAP